MPKPPTQELSMKKTVLVVAYHFPPGGGPGVQRVLKHVTYLRDANWHPVVLTVENGDFPARDESLLQLIPDDVPVIRIPIVEPYTMYRKFIGASSGAVDVNVNKSAADRKGLKEKIAHAIRATFFVPDARVGWWYPAARAAIAAVKEYNASVLYSSSPPYTCALVARTVKRKTNIPWVAGFRDPWTGFLTTPDRWFLPLAIDKAMERSVFTEADAVECAWQGIIDDALAKMPSLNSNKFYHIPNGFDSADFPQTTYTPNERFTITYTGSLYGRRTPQALLSALELLYNNGDVAIQDVSLVFVGRFGTEVAEMLERSVFAPSITSVGYVPHRQSIVYLQRSEMSLLIVDDAKESADIVPGKVYEYMGIGRPVLAIAPANSAIEKLLIETNAGFSYPSANTTQIAECLLKAIKQWRTGHEIVMPRTDVIAGYERRNAALSLASIFDTLTGEK